MKINTVEVPLGDSRIGYGDFSLSAARLGTSLSSAVWSIEEGTSITLNGTPSIDGNVAQELLVASATITGCTLVKVKGTMANSEKVTEYAKVMVIDPTC